MLAALACAAACGGSSNPASNLGGPSDAGPPPDGGPSPEKRTLAVVRSGSGTVRSNPAGVDCGAVCSEVLDQGAQVSLTAIADAGWAFAGWSGACGGAGACTVSLSADATVYATFQTVAVPGSHKLSVARAGDGTGHVGSTPAGIDCGTACEASFTGSPSVTLSATADGGSQFSSWSGACTGAGTCTVTMSGDVAVTATFAKKAPPPPADECKGFNPSAPGTPVSLEIPRLATTDRMSCRPGTSDAHGNVTFGWAKEHHSGTFFASSTGAVLGSHDDYGHPLGVLIGQLDGFEGVYVYPGSANDQWELDVVAGDGTIRRTVQNQDQAIKVNGSTQANDPTGGVIVLGTYPRILFAFDAAGNLRWRVPVEDGHVLGVDRLGNALVLFDGGSRYGQGTTAGQWVDHAGHPGAVFDAKVPAGVFASLYPRVGGGFFYRTGRVDASHYAWSGQFDSLAKTGTPPPAWLAARPDTKLSMAHGGRAYAVLPEGYVPTCAENADAQMAEVVAPSGKSCGSVKFTGAQAACSLEIGYDGTVLQQFYPDESRHTCGMRWWPGFFR